MVNISRFIKVIKAYFLITINCGRAAKNRIKLSLIVESVPAVTVLLQRKGYIADVICANSAAKHRKNAIVDQSSRKITIVDRLIW